jgi:hypothetical protein
MNCLLMNCLYFRIPDGWFTSDTSSVTNHLDETITFHLESDDYVNSLPDYDAMLLQQVNFHFRSLHQLCQALLHTDTLLLVRDGGADENIRSPGWVIADSLGNRFVNGSSSIPGFDPRSYQAEGYTMVSGLSFLHHLCLFCQHLNQLPVKKLYCDTLGLLRKLTHFSAYRLAPIKCVLHSEYAVLAQSFLLLQAYPRSSFSIHQDTTTRGRPICYTQSPKRHPPVLWIPPAHQILCLVPMYQINYQLNQLG